MTMRLAWMWSLLSLGVAIAAPGAAESQVAAGTSIAASATAPAADAATEAMSGEKVDAQVCRKCHVTQYEEWSVSDHGLKNVQCFQCHGTLHSASLLGCKDCHQAIHKKRFTNWPQVTRFDEEGNADYMCMLCHSAHRANLKESMREGCIACHGSAGNTAYGDLFHLKFSSAVSPIYVDTFARERFGMAARLLSMPKGHRALIGLGIAAAGYGLCFAIFLPLGYIASLVWDSVRSRFRR